MLGLGQQLRQKFTRGTCTDLEQHKVLNEVLYADIDLLVQVISRDTVDMPLRQLSIQAVSVSRSFIEMIAQLPTVSFPTACPGTWERGKLFV